MWKNQQYVLQGGFKRKQTEHEKNKTYDDVVFMFGNNRSEKVIISLHVLTAITGSYILSSPLK